MSVLVKICGITHVQDAKLSLEAGADWIGLNLIAGPRRIACEKALAIVEAVNHADAFVLLVDAATIDSGRLRALSNLEGRARLQVYHRGEHPAPKVPGFRSIAVHHVSDDASLAALDRYTLPDSGWHADYVLLDAAVSLADGRLGGTGRKANWEAIARARSRGRFAHWPPVILAGGLTPDNVADAVRRIRPFGVDVSSGVEKSPGIKDPAKVEAFIAAAKNA